MEFFLTGQPSTGAGEAYAYTVNQITLLSSFPPLLICHWIYLLTPGKIPKGFSDFCFFFQQNPTNVFAYLCILDVKQWIRIIPPLPTLPELPRSCDTYLSGPCTNASTHVEMKISTFAVATMTTDQRLGPLENIVLYIRYKRVPPGDRIYPGDGTNFVFQRYYYIISSRGLVVACVGDYGSIRIIQV